MKAKHIKVAEIWNLLFADDAALVSTKLEEIQSMVGVFNELCGDFGLQISIKKTEVMKQEMLTPEQKSLRDVCFDEAKARKVKVLSEIVIDGQNLNLVALFKSTWVQRSIMMETCRMRSRRG